MTAYLVTVPGLGTYAIEARDSRSALAEIATDVWNASGGTVALDTSRCTARVAIAVVDGVDLFR